MPDAYLNTKKTNFLFFLYSHLDESTFFACVHWNRRTHGCIKTTTSYSIEYKTISTHFTLSSNCTVKVDQFHRKLSPSSSPDFLSQRSFPEVWTGWLLASLFGNKEEEPHSVYFGFTSPPVQCFPSLDRAPLPRLPLPRNSPPQCLSCELPPCAVPAYKYTSVSRMI